jgi:hypothetical protein
MKVEKNCNVTAIRGKSGDNQHHPIQKWYEMYDVADNCESFTASPLDARYDGYWQHEHLIN